MLFNNPDTYIKEVLETQKRETAQYWAICETENCFNKNIPILVDVFFSPPTIYCGCCNTLINNAEKIET